jgi:hypothetical protein
MDATKKVKKMPDGSGPDTAEHHFHPSQWEPMPNGVGHRLKLNAVPVKNGILQPVPPVAFNSYDSQNCIYLDSKGQRR